MPIFDPDGKCPLLNKKCIKTQCIWYNMLQGTQAATESFRNEMVKSQTAMNQLLQGSDSAKNLAMNTASIFELIGNHQRAIQEKDEKAEDETIRQLSNNKVKVKKGKKDGNNSK